MFGALLYLGTLSYHYLLSHLGGFGPVDMLVSVTGIILLTPYLLSLCETSRMRHVYLVIGLLLLIASVHDLVGVNLTDSTHMKFMDVLCFLTGAMFITPYLASMGACRVEAP